ncbi:MAG: TonB family protein [Bacteroidota bacterium]
MAKHLKADLDDMVFEDRERNYGAYFLRKRYPRYLTTAVGIVAFLALCGSFGPLIAKGMGWIKETEEIEELVHEIILSELPPPPPIDDLNDPPPPPPPPVVKEIKQVEFRIPEPSPEPDLEDTTTIHKIEDLVDQNLGFDDVEGEEMDVLFTDIVDSEEIEVLVDKDPPPGVFQSVDAEPVPINLRDIQKLVGYPSVAQQAGIQGKVILRILVDKQGRYKKHIMQRSDHPLLSEPVEKHISKLKFTPAIQGSRPIKFWVNIPFNFVLQK